MEKKLEKEEVMEEMNLEDLEQTTGGIASLRDAPKEKVGAITDSIKSKI